MKRIYDRLCIGKILIRERKIRIVHITDEITNPFALLHRDSCKVWFGYALSSAGNHVYGLPGYEIKENQSVFAFAGYFQVHFVNAQNFAKRKPFHVDESIKDFQHIGV